MPLFQDAMAAGIPVTVLLPPDNSADIGKDWVEIAAKYNVHPTLVNQWKRALLDGASGVFDVGTTKAEKQSEVTTNELYKQIGQMKVEIDFLSRKLGR